MVRKPKFKYDKDLRVQGFFERLAKYQCGDIDRFREQVEEQRARKIETAHKLAAELPAEIEGFLSDELREIDTISGLADELSIVALYRVVELNTARIVVYEFGPAAKQKASRIDGVKDLLMKNMGLKLETVPHYRAINELRLLNNAIKHEGVVSDDLAKAFPRWKRGSALSGLDKAYKRLGPRVPIYILRLSERMKLKYKS